MFNQSQTVDTRMAVIEERFTSYEKMMDKLDNAIQTISEINQNILRMLSVHEEKIDNAIKTDDILFDKLKRLEQKNTEEHQKVINKLESLEEVVRKDIKAETTIREEEVKDLKGKIESITKYRWIVAGGLAVAVFIFTNSHIIVDILTPNQTSVNIERVN